MTSPVVSIVIPTAQRSALLRRAIQSIIDQTYPNWELIVVENGPNQRSGEMIRAWQRTEPRIRYLSLAVTGPSRARNAGIRLARGAYVAFLDDDDEWLPTKLERELAVLDKDPQVDLVSCRCFLVNDQGDLIGQQPRYPGLVTFESLLADGNRLWSLSGVVVRRACFDRVGLFDTRYWIADDYHFYLRVALDGRILSLDDALFYYRWHAGGLSRKPELVADEVGAMLGRLRVSLVSRRARRSVEQALARHGRECYGIASGALSGGEYGLALRHLIVAVRCDPLVGLHVDWGRYQSRLYRLIRPYAAIVYSGCRLLPPSRRIAEPHVSKVDR